MVATPNTDSPMYQKNIGSGQVERGVHQRVGFGVQLASYVGEVDFLVLAEQRTRARVERLQVRLLDPPTTGDLLDHELRVAAHAGDARGCRRRRLEPGDARAVLRHALG